MNREQFHALVAHHGALRSEREARDVVRAVLVALAGTLSSAEVALVTEELPGWMQEIMRQACRQEGASLVDQIAAREGVARGPAREHAGVVLQALAAELSPDTRQYLRRALPPQVAELLEPRTEAETVVAGPRAARRKGSPLATGRPGSRHPLSEARLDPAHRHSVARTGDPHADSKLSESRGTAQDRRGETLATGRPGSRRPLSGGGG
jgi:uncharacterized protein (DUF2267 family)